MAILVTGGAGYIGSHTCVELLEKGYDIIVVDNFSNSKPESLKRVAELTGRDFKTFTADLLDRESLDNIFAENKIEAVIHLAGLKAVGESMMFPLSYYQHNIMGTINLCEVMKKYKVKKIVFSSSATVYGFMEQVPISEEAKLGAVNPYGRTKQMIEEILGDLFRSDETWSIALLRYFNPIGAHESGRIGEDPNGIPNNLLPYISQVAVGKMESLNVYGNDYETVDGTGVRDYIHVVDLAVGHIKALEKVQSTSGINAYNLGTGRGYSVLEIVKAFEKASSQSIPYTIEARRPGDIGTCYANPTKAKEQLGFEAKRDIEDMCGDAWRWQLNNPNGYEKLIEMVIKKESLV
jgi:UDP-glucose 4-epimerase